ncbi:hypothetical protein CLU83_0785 [Flavobacterium sp. 1]|uniref:hypothetical protein n=1 Tax=Flavobacterium sp. 1 TaxID=2035200 RepID=UPI000C235F85|nr:hypothetical protein [Flavobacterium sp. 1]PJJ07599.1 hypothetical protein CLU83_0785 [Flavobacterium sp. 1]
MKLEAFLERFSLEIIEENIDNRFYVIITKLIDKADDLVIDLIETKLEINKLNDWIKKTNSPISITPYNWEMVINITKRGQIDFFAQMFGIDNFFPKNVETDISFVRTKIN